MTQILLTTFPHGTSLDIPDYATPLSSGLDLRAAVAEPVVLGPGMRDLIPCGFAMAMPSTLEAQVRPRSGLALKHGVTVLNAPGTIDADYHGEVKVILINHGQEPFTIDRGMRIAQLVFAPVQRIAWTRVDDLAELGQEASGNLRQSGGFGSTGVR